MERPASPSSSCCGGAGKDAARPASDDALRATVREHYGAIADRRPSAVGGCCGKADPDAVLPRIGYDGDDAAALPDGANLGLGCGNPVALADVRPGETVLDLGSGAGIDCFLAARRVGDTGRVIGVDMTPSMLARAREIASREGLANVTFRLGEIEHLPVADASIDLIVSNCVVNLSPDKPQVLREALRVLKPGGRLVVSDLVLTRPLDASLCERAALYVDCVAGAALEGDFLRMLEEAGFVDVQILAEDRYEPADLDPESPEQQAFGSVVSLKVRAVRPPAARSACCG